MLTTALIFFVILVAMLIVYIGGNAKNDPRDQGFQYAHLDYHAVELQPHSGCCQAARQLHGQRMLCAEAQSLPLAQCTSKRCQCQYRHMGDRRQLKRRVHIGLLHDLHSRNGEPERRSNHMGRRRSD